MTSNPPIASMRPTRRTRATHVLAMAIACLALASRGLPAQSPYSALVGLGVGAVPAEHRHPGTAVSIAVFRRVGSALDLGFEVVARDGQGTPEQRTIRLAYNDAPGQYAVKITDVRTGLSAQSSLQVK